jgi:uncharacterized protein YkwD
MNSSRPAFLQRLFYLIFHGLFGFTLAVLSVRVAYASPLPLRVIHQTDEPGAPLSPEVLPQGQTTADSLSLLHNVFVPLVMRPGASLAAPIDESQAALDRLNMYRVLAGVNRLQLEPTIINAAQRHSSYFLLNHDDPTAWIYGYHGEVDGKAGYSGQWPADRMTAAGFSWSGRSEVMHFLGDPAGSIDGWMTTVYHRIVLLDPKATHAGYSRGQIGPIVVDILDLGTGPTLEGSLSKTTPYPLAYPANGQVDVPVSWNGAENPNPLPPGAKQPVGYPFTLQGAMGKLKVEWAEMRDQYGLLVNLHPNPVHCVDFNCHALIPVQPLKPGISYTVRATGLVGDVPFNSSWTFRTAGTPTSAIAAEVSGERMGPSLLVFPTADLSGEDN